MEDAQLVAPSAALSRDDDVSPPHSRDGSFSYQPMPFSSNDTPLLQSIRPDYARPDSSSRDYSSTVTLLRSPDRRSDVESFDTSSSAGGMRSSLTDTDIQGEAPPYYEVNNAYPPPSSPPPASIDSRLSTPVSRVSGFRNIFNVLGHSGSRASAANTSPRSPSRPHSRAGSSLSTDIPLPDPSHSRDASSPFRFSHRSTHSAGSISLLNVPSLRPVSRQSNSTIGSQRVNSASQISLQSISAPLTHTLVRTEFTLPKAGLTPEQLKVISSRDSLGKFGIPYGPDAIAYAASNSRNELPPPPDFPTPAISGPSPLRGEIFPAPTREPDPSPADAAPTSWPAGPATAADHPITQDFETNDSQAQQPSKTQVTAAVAAEDDDDDAGSTRRPTPEINPPAPASGASISPPSVYKLAAAPRSASRTSSLQSDATYATAEESMGITTPTATATTTGSDSGPSTAQFRLGHGQEGTDETVVPGRHSPATPADSHLSSG